MLYNAQNVPRDLHSERKYVYQRIYTYKISCGKSRLKNRKILKIVRSFDKYLVFFGKHIIDAQYVRQILPNLGYKIVQYSFAEVSKRLNWKGPSS